MATIAIPAPTRSFGSSTARRPARASVSGASLASSVRLTRRGRRLARTLVVTVLLVTALVASFSGRGAVGQATDGPATSATTTVIVQPGQTLWQVARAVSRDADPRETLARIQELNGLSGAAATSLRPGQQLIVPVAG